MKFVPFVFGIQVLMSEAVRLQNSAPVKGDSSGSELKDGSSARGLVKPATSHDDSKIAEAQSRPKPEPMSIERNRSAQWLWSLSMKRMLS